MAFIATLSVNYQCYSIQVIHFDPWTVAGWLAGYPLWLGLGPVTADGWERLRGPWTGQVWWNRGPEGVWGAGVYAEPQGEQQPAGVPTPTLTCTRRGGTKGSGGLYDHREDKKKASEREWGIACVFPRHASSCETMIYAFLRTLGSQNVTFNQAHWEQSKRCSL